MLEEHKTYNDPEEGIEMQKRKKADAEFEFRTNAKRNSSDELYQSNTGEIFAEKNYAVERD